MGYGCCICVGLYLDASARDRSCSLFRRSRDCATVYTRPARAFDRFHRRCISERRRVDNSFARCANAQPHARLRLALGAMRTVSYPTSATRGLLLPQFGLGSLLCSGRQRRNKRSPACTRRRSCPYNRNSNCRIHSGLLYRSHPSSCESNGDGDNGPGPEKSPKRSTPSSRLQLRFAFYPRS